MDDIEMIPCYNLCWWAMSVLEKHYSCLSERDPGGLVAASVNLDWAIDLELEAM